MTFGVSIPLTKNQKRFLVFIQLLNEYSVKYTSISIMIEGEPLDINLINTIVSDNQYTIDNREYLGIITDGFKEVIDSSKNQKLNGLWKEYINVCKINNLMEVSNTSARILLETKLKRFFENTR